MSIQTEIIKVILAGKRAGQGSLNMHKEGAWY